MLKLISLAAFALLACSASGPPATQEVKLLNASYDPTRELYAAVNVAFARHWEAKTARHMTIEQSHGGSGKQGRTMIDGLDDVFLSLRRSRVFVTEGASS